jgi:hypothetical protein
LSKEILFNKGFVQNVAQMLLSFDDPNMWGQAYAALEEANQTANRSRYKFQGLQKKLEIMPTSSDAASITLVDPSGQVGNGKITASSNQWTGTGQDGAPFAATRSGPPTSSMGSGRQQQPPWLMAASAQWTETL